MDIMWLYVYMYIRSGEVKKIKLVKLLWGKDSDFVVI